MHTNRPTRMQPKQALYPTHNRPAEEEPRTERLELADSSPRQSRGALPQGLHSIDHISRWIVFE
jgi:hypothetical protein